MFDILTIVPGKKKQTQSGWTSFNAPCCVHNGHSQDKRMRGGVKIDGDNFTTDEQASAVKFFDILPKKTLTAHRNFLQENKII